MYIPLHILSSAETFVETAATNNAFVKPTDVLSAFASVIAVVVSIVALGRSYRASHRAAYLETITTSRERWQVSLRTSSAQYFSQLMRICSPYEQNDYEAFTLLTQYHHEIRLHLFRIDDALIAMLDKTLEHASEILQVRAKLSELEKLPESANKKHDIAQLQSKLDYRIRCVLACEKPKLVQYIAWLIEIEWRKQQEESTAFWGKGIGRKIKRIRNHVYKEYSLPSK